MKYKCLECGEKFTDKNSLFSHYETDHDIPKDWSGARYNFYLKYGRTTGRCSECGKETSWNESTKRTNKFCGNPKCVENYAKRCKQNMLRKYGKEHLLNDPNVQKKMLAGRSISGIYKWSDGAKKQYVGSYELDFLRFLDVFLNFESNDVLSPAPQVFEYEYEGKKHFYIPDIYIASINTVVEIKDGGSNPNTHPKIMQVDKVKEALKDKMMEKQNVNYIKIVDKKYSNFIKFLADLDYTKDEFKAPPQTIKINESLFTDMRNNTMIMVTDNNNALHHTMNISFDGLQSFTCFNHRGDRFKTFAMDSFKRVPNLNVRIYKYDGDLYDRFNAYKDYNSTEDELLYKIVKGSEYPDNSEDVFSYLSELKLFYSGKISEFNMESNISKPEQLSESETGEREIVAVPIDYVDKDDMAKYYTRVRDMRMKIFGCNDSRLCEIFNMIINAQDLIDIKIIITLYENYLASNNNKPISYETAIELRKIIDDRVKYLSVNIDNQLIRKIQF